MLILGLAVAFVAWWTIFQVGASRQLEVAGAHLAAGDPAGVAAAFGVTDGTAVAALGRSRVWMFASEGTVFLVALGFSGWLFAASVRREVALRRTQDRFLAGATHELKTPLATISLLLESLRDNRLPAEKRERYLRMGLVETDRLERGLTNVLVAAGLRTAALGDRRTLGDLADDAAQAVAALEARALTAQVQVAVQAATPVRTLRDAEALQLVLHNLLDNAIKYSRAGGTVTVEVAAVDDRARIAVRDHGRGLDAQELAHAFEPFWRGSDVATGGAGLGLHLVRELVEAHRGGVAVHSRGRDQGAEFLVWLPITGVQS